MKPLIGINLNQEGNKLTLRMEYWTAVTEAGGTPIAIAPVTSLDDADRVLEPLDGLLLTGGGDIDPARYGEAPHKTTQLIAQPKHDSDFLVASRALEFGMPVLGICYGMQLLSVLHGGKLLQDIGSNIKGAHDHYGSPDRDAEHPVRIEPGTRVHSLVGCASLLINSHHHQAVSNSGSLKVAARAEDGVVEAVEAKDRWVVGVEWHPERMKDRTQVSGLFRGLIEAAEAYAGGSGYDVTFLR